MSATVQRRVSVVPEATERTIFVPENATGGQVLQALGLSSHQLFAGGAKVEATAILPIDVEVIALPYPEGA